MRRRKRLWILASVLIVLGLLLAACAPGKEATPAPSAGTPAATAIPGAKATPAPVSTSAPAVASEPKRGGILNTAHRRTPSLWDLADTSTIDNTGTVTPAYNQLFQAKHPDYLEIEGDLVKEWKYSEDGKTLTLKIHPGVVDHKGNPLTASDVKFSLERIANPKLNNSMYFMNTWKSIDVVDDTTVALNLVSAQASLIPRLSSQYYMITTEKAWKSEDLTKTAVGTGPYFLEDHKPGTSLTYKRNPNYFKKGLPYLDGITLYAIKDSSTMRSAFLAKRLDIILIGSSHGFFEEHWQDVEKIAKGEMTWIKGIHYANRTIKFNLRAKGPWQDVRVRKAINLAMDRQAAEKSMPLAAVYAAYVPPTGLWNIPVEEFKTMPGWRQPKDQDIAEAKRLMAEAGYPNGFEMKVLIRDTEDFREYHGPFVAFELESKLGIKSKLDVQESAVWTDTLRDHKFDVEYGVGFAIAIDDPDMAFQREVSYSDMNDTGYNNPEFDRLYEQQQVSLDPSKRKEIALKMSRILLQDLSHVDVWHATRTGGWWNYVKSPPVEKNSGQYSQARRLEYTWLER